MGRFNTLVTIPLMQRRLPLAHFAHATWSLPEGREKSGTCLQCVLQRSTRSIETQMVFQSIPMDFISWYNPIQAFTVKHVSYPRLTATDATKYIISFAKRSIIMSLAHCYRPHSFS